MARPSSRRSSPTSLTIRPENNHPERTRRLLFAEGDEVDSSGSGLHVQDSTRYASGFADVLAGFANRGDSRKLIAACRVGWPMRLHVEPGCEGPAARFDFAQPRRWAAVPTFMPVSFRRSRFYEGNTWRERWGETKSKRLPGMKPAHRQSTDALQFGPAPRS